ncbi:MAG: T9SS type A sorting domain-containing protein [Stygiobacter sp.]
MKKISIFILVFFLFISLVYSQPTITETIIISPSQTNIYKDNNSTFSYSNYALGREGGKFFKVSRSLLTLSLLQIPTNATINQVKVNYMTFYKPYTFKLTNISSPGNTLASQWTSIGNSPSFHTGLGYGSSNFISTTIKTQMQNSLSSRSMIIGVAAENETDSTSFSTLMISFEVNITRPAQQLTIIIKNDMDGYSGGLVGVGIAPNDPIATFSPATIKPYETQSLKLAAYDNQNGNNGFNYVFNDIEGTTNKSEWILQDIYGKKIFSTSSQTFTTSPLTLSEDNVSFIAKLRKLFNVTFYNSMPENGGNTGYINVDGSNYNVTKVINKVDGNTITFWALSNQPVINNIQPFFYKWSDGSTTNPRTETIISHNNFTAIFKGKPLTNNRNLHFNDGQIGEYITLNWNSHSSPNVTSYKVYRKIRINGNMGNEVLLATLPASVTSYIDYDYIVSNGTTTQLFYDVRYIYNGVLPDNTTYTTESEPEFQNIYGQIAPDVKDEKIKVSLEKEIPGEFSISNYPNPFNPTTKIKYELPKDGFISIKIYDALGKEITTLVNDYKKAGIYTTEFNSLNSELPSGIYFCRLVGDNVNITSKLILAK